jgi:hypothetical protein
MEGSSSCKRTRTGCLQYMSNLTLSSDNDLEEDELMKLKLQRLYASGGNSASIWTEVPEFAGLTRATRAKSRGVWLRKKGVWTYRHP